MRGYHWSIGFGAGLSFEGGEDGEGGGSVASKTSARAELAASKQASATGHFTAVQTRDRAERSFADRLR